MGTKQQAGLPAKRANTLPANWEAQMKDDAAKGRQQVAKIGTSQRLKTQGGVLTYMDAPMPGNAMDAVILAKAFENSYYEGAFDPQNTEPPVCFAFASTSDLDDGGMVPHKDAPKPQAKTCGECPHNKFGSAEKGRGKACKNGIHVALIHADSLRKGVPDAEVVTLSVPPTSLPLYKGFVKKMEQLAGAKPVYGFTTNISLTPRQQGGFFVNLNPVKEIDRKLMPQVFAKAKAAEKAVDERPPFPPKDEAAAKAPKGGKKPGKKKY